MMNENEISSCWTNSYWTNSYWVAAFLLASLFLLRHNPLVAQTTDASPLRQAHAHNDYEHPRPLLDALDQGFTNVEADVYLVDGELLVAHDRDKVSKQRTLESLYLIPLQRRVQQHGGKVFQNGAVFTLLVDIKRDGIAAYAVLDKLLAKYESMLSVTRDGVYSQKAVIIVVSGDRPISRIVDSNPRWVGIDGRLSDLDSDRPASLMPWISDNWTLHFQYRGVGQMSDAEREKLRNFIRKAHDQKRRVRFWATPEKESLWSELTSADVDILGTDQLAMLSNYLRRSSAPAEK